ncbi:MAG: A/G-specific adenine glycosylase [Gemmatimonadales bacterium]
MTWFGKHGRDLPWRRTRDPYRILVSEFMLQQTQVSRVEGFYYRFLDRYPDLSTLAAASPALVRESWEGLGYYRRADNLHRLARTIQADHAGTIPADVETLRRLPGVGRYTAGAVATFAYELAEAAVDTNVARVLRRAFHPRTGATAREERRLWDTAKALVPEPGPNAWSFNQGIMELGARVCTAREARCGECPVRPVCYTGRRRTGVKAGRGRRSGARSGPAPRKSSRTVPASREARRTGAPD